MQEEQIEQIEESKEPTVKDMIKKSTRNYLGLSNLGNTCYMNSLLQTLFMTRGFREELFKWTYSDKQEQKQEDCIPLQLQMLFARMQMLVGSLKETEARKLIKSFQWDANESFAQHDVQEFCRVLFEAIQQSCITEQEFITKLYESHSQSYVRCQKCKIESLRSDTFMDLSLTVKSEFDNVYNESLEKALKYYLKPETLEGDNLYFCEKCNEKVEALKGFRITQLSEILTIQLNRFELDLQTFDRKKVNNWVSYPFVLDMNNFLKPYQDIVVYEDKVFLEERDKLIKKQQEENDSKPKNLEHVDLYDDPLRRKRKNRVPSPDEKNKKMKDVTFVKDDLAKEKLLQETQAEQNLFTKKEKSNLKLSNQQLGQKLDHLSEKNPNLKRQGEEYIEAESSTKKAKFNVTTQNPNLIMTADEAYDLDNDMLFGQNGFEMKELGSGFQQHEQPKLNQQHDVIDDNDIIREIQEISHHQDIQDQINSCLTHGPNVYELYSIMIHSGGASAGHYYAYIKSFENNRWYCFNDNTVDRIKWQQVKQMYGDKVPKYNSGVSAYFLMYRRAEKQELATLPTIPSSLQTLLEKEMEVERLRREKEEKEQKEKANELRIRAFYKSTDQVIRCKRSDTLVELKQLIVKVLQVKEDPENTRLRFYNYQDSFMLETFRGKENQTLQELKFNEYKNLIVETKSLNEVFQDFDPNLLMFKINVWRNGIDALDENHLKPLNNDKKVSDLLDVIAEKAVLDRNYLVLQRRNPMGQKSFSEIVNDLPEIQDKTFSQLKLINCLNLYVEEVDSNWKLGDTTKWNKEFEEDKFRCTIIFNDPRLTASDLVPEYNYELSMDTRLTMYELKAKVADILGLDMDNFLMKRGSRFSAEIKDLSTIIRDNGIIGRGTLFLLNGKPATQGQFKVKINIGSLSKQQCDSIEYDFEELFELTIQNDKTVVELKQQLCQELEQRQGVKYDYKNIRLREKINTKLGKVFHNGDLLKTHRLYDRQALVIQPLSHAEETLNGQILLYAKFFNLLDYDLSYPPEELFVYQTTTLQEIALILSERFNVPVDFIEACKINNIYSFRIDDLILSQFDWLNFKDTTMELERCQFYCVIKYHHTIYVSVRDSRTIPDDITDYKKKAKEIKLAKVPVSGQKQIQSIISSNPDNILVQVTPAKRIVPKEKALKIRVIKNENQPKPTNLEDNKGQKMEEAVIPEGLQDNNAETNTEIQDDTKVEDQETQEQDDVARVEPTNEDAPSNP